jgi:DNA invertase Pin-like site-specific DNA recombinase
MPQEIGYSRVSNRATPCPLVRCFEKAAGVRLFTDKQTGTRFDRKEFLAALDYLNEGDTLVVWKLDRQVDVHMIFYAETMQVSISYYANIINLKP